MLTQNTSRLHDTEVSEVFKEKDLHIDEGHREPADVSDVLIVGARDRARSAQLDVA